MIQKSKKNLEMIQYSVAVAADLQPWLKGWEQTINDNHQPQNIQNQT